jgi:serine/threonine protein kinase
MEEMQNLGILDNQYILISLKSEDAFNFYYAARDNQNQNDFIIEIRTNEINKDNNKKINNIPANDFNILNTLNNANCPFILRYIGNGNGPLILNNQPPINVHYTLYEYASIFVLGDYIRNQSLSERHAKLIFKKILNGVQAIHNANICHRNIDIWHIIFDENYIPKIFSFNLSRLNANYLQGESAAAFTRRTRDENITGRWAFRNITEFHNNASFSKDIVLNGSIGTPYFASGFGGSGWRLDAETNTLTVDNLIVRKLMQVYELVVNKISATNGSLWVTNAGKVSKC